MFKYFEDYFFRNFIGLVNIFKVMIRIFIILKRSNYEVRNKEEK